MTTPKDFDYDLWKTKDGKFYARIKRTGDVCEVDAETFRTLHNEAMTLYRDQQGIPVYTVRDGKSVLAGRVPLLHLGYDTDGDDVDEVWAVEPTQTEDEYVTAQMEQAFRTMLTPKQLDIYQTCMLGGISATEYARVRGVSKAFVSKYIAEIRDRAKKFFKHG
ncbi:hypothetical protein RFF05_15935 [Bengtsoniella intestinalis]|uniref:hypothetical protein n=1 Tax=Bengtsoniella intestinalis TaxID=3073143 RepID=UPI00391F61E9